MNVPRKVRLAGAATLAMAAMVATMTTQAVTASAAPVPTISYTQFNLTFNTMKLLKPVTAMGKGGILALLPDTTSSTRYVEFDQPMLAEAMKYAGLSGPEIQVQNAHGNDAAAFAYAQAGVARGDKVIIMDPEDSGVGARIESYAAAHGVKVIDYDRLTLGGKPGGIDAPYYDSFNNVQVGHLLGEGLVSCIDSGLFKIPGGKKPQVVVMHGSATDNNATMFASGYNAVLDPIFASGKWTLVERTADTWTPDVAETEFEQAYTAHPNINAALIPNDETGAPIISYLKTKGIKPYTFPTTGQDATLTGLGNVLTGYQCGTVYKPIFLEAQAAVALAIYLRAGLTPPASLVNGTTLDPTTHKSVKSVLLTPEWVTAKTMASTVIKDRFVPASSLCAAPYATAAACKSAGIKP
jgi:D-xylose transport system substrate-binding protein